MSNGKGSKRRPGDDDAYRQTHDRVYPKSKQEAWLEEKERAEDATVAELGNF
jgi:hypothetical protein